MRLTGFERHREVVGLGVLLAFGLLLLWGSLRLAIWAESGPQEGFFPLLIAIVMCVLSLFMLVKEFALLSERTGESRRGRVQDEGGEAPQLRKAILYGVGMLAYWAALTTLGFVLASILFLLFALKIVERQRWKISLAITAGTVAISHFVFVFFLKVPLPRGWLG